MIRWIRLSALLLLLVAHLGYAKVVTGLNTAEVPVASQAKSEFDTALTKAYQQVLIKLSGNPAVLSIPQIQNSVHNKSAYLASYSYRQQLDQETNTPQLYLSTVFDEHALKQLLEGAGQTLWGANRPLTLVVLASRSGANWQIGADDEPSLRVFIRKFAENYGLTVIFLALDLEDQEILADLNGLGLTQQQLQALCGRYGVQAVLYAGIDTEEQDSAIDWRLSLAGQAFQWSSHAATQREAMTQGMNRLLETYANQYATLSSDRLQSSLLLKISGVDSLQDYAQISATLAHLSVVKGVTMKGMEGNVVLFEVAVLGGRAALEQALRKSHFVPELAAKNEAQTTVDYHWAAA